jgi:catalase
MNKARILRAIASGTLLAMLAASAAAAVTPDEIVHSFEATFDVNADGLAKNGDCVCVSGQFTGTSVASALSRSVLFTHPTVPVIARFSAARGNANRRNSREMELEFRLPGGGLHHMAMLNTASFGAADAVEFGEMIVAVKPDPNTGAPDLQRLHAFLAAHPDAFAQSNFATATDAPSDYASATYFSIHTFRFIDAEGRAHFVRWRFLPQDEGTTSSPSEAADALPERLSERLAGGPVRWDMIVYVGEPADTSDNASLAWPQGRKHFKAGTLTLTRHVHERAEQCARRTFDPLVVTDGIAPTDDPVLLLRSPTYGVTFSKILAQALASPDAAAVADR